MNKSMASHFKDERIIPFQHIAILKYDDPWINEYSPNRANFPISVKS